MANGTHFSGWEQDGKTEQDGTAAWQPEPAMATADGITIFNIFTVPCRPAGFAGCCLPLARFHVNAALTNWLLHYVQIQNRWYTLAVE